VIGAVTTASGRQAFGLVFAVATAFAMLSLAAVSGLVVAIAVLLTRERGRFRLELARPPHTELPADHTPR
jgi:hypothetical protein